MRTLLAFSLVGLVTGSIYAITASGLVLTYTASGIFNFAHGAIGMILAFSYWQLRVGHGWPAAPAATVVLLVVAPLLGLLLERVFFRDLLGARTGTSVVVSVGLLLALVGTAYSVWDPSRPRAVPELLAGRGVRAAGVFVTAHQLVVLAAAAGVAMLLWLLLHRTRAGVTMRAVVDDRELAALNGVSPVRVAQFSWALASVLAGVAGVLIAPQLQLDVLQLTLLVVNGYAAAMVGRLTSLPLAFAGALGLGLAESYAVGFLPTSGFLSHVRPVLPMVLLLGVLVLLPRRRLDRDGTVTAERPGRPRLARALAAAAGLVAAALVVAPVLSDYTLGVVGLGLALGIVMLSLVLLTGYAGQLSLCQLTFVGLGAFAMARVGGGDSVLGVVAAAALAAAAGVVVGLPALRVQGLYLALATLAFAVLMDTLFFLDRRVFERGSLTVGRLRLAGLSLGEPGAYLVLLAVVFAGFAVLFVAIARGRFGRLLAATRDDPEACAVLGLDLSLTRLAVFALSAAMAGVAGALFAGLRGTVTANDFVYVQSLVLLLVATVGGLSLVSGALLGGMLLAVVPIALAQVPGVRGAQFLAAGLAGAVVARSPHGVAGYLSGAVGRRRAAPEPAIGGEDGRRVTAAG